MSVCCLKTELSLHNSGFCERITSAFNRQVQPLDEIAASRTLVQNHAVGHFFSAKCLFFKLLLFFADFLPTDPFQVHD
jgi:hypothetical protein